MAVSIIENWSDITGTVQSVSPSIALQEFAEVKVEVSEVRDVDGFPNLLKTAAGQPLTITMSKAKALSMNVTAGKSISCRVRKAGPNRTFVHPDLIEVK